MELKYQIPEPYYADQTCIYFLTKKDKIPFYVGKTVAPAPRMLGHKENFGENIEMFLYKLVPDSKWKVEERKAIKKFTKAGFKLKNKDKGGSGAERGNKSNFNLDKYLERCRQSYGVILPDKAIDTIKMVHDKLKKDKQKDIRYHIELLVYTIVAHHRMKYQENIYKLVRNNHVKVMKEMYPGYSISIE